MVVVPNVNGSNAPERESMVPTVVTLLLHVPPGVGSVSVTMLPRHSGGTTMLAGVALTVITSVATAVPHAVEIVYTIVTGPVVVPPVTMPVSAPTVAIAV